MFSQQLGWLESSFRQSQLIIPCKFHCYSANLNHIKGTLPTFKLAVFVATLFKASFERIQDSWEISNYQPPPAYLLVY
jgi:hypothetical protein